MGLLMSATGSSESPGKVEEAKACSPMSQERIETLKSKMPEIFHQNHDWIGVFLTKDLKEFFYLLCSAFYRITFALVERCTGPFTFKKAT